jgi:hypothetical protein
MLNNTNIIFLHSLFSIIRVTSNSNLKYPKKISVYRMQTHSVCSSSYPTPGEKAAATYTQSIISDQQLTYTPSVFLFVMF